MSEQQHDTPNPAEPAVDAEIPADVAAEAEAQVDADVDADIGPDGTPVDATPADGADDEAPAEAPAEEEPDWKDRYLRSVAELDNVRKRARRDAAAGEVRGVTRLARELLPAMDNLDRAIQHVESDVPEGTGDQQLVEGLRIVHREMHAALAQAGIESYDPTGQEFDPRFHEAMTTAPAADDVLPGTVVTVYQAGYRRGDDVIRAAKVVVAG